MVWVVLNRFQSRPGMPPPEWIKLNGSSSILLTVQAL